MYVTLLAFHSLLRWLVLASLIYALYRAYKGWLSHLPFTKHDNTVRSVTTAIAQVQLILGVWLYAISPLTTYFLQHFKEALHERQIRFFGMEHSTMMLIAIVLISLGSFLAKRKPTDHLKFRTMAIWFTVALLLILSSIPWAFSPLISRPWMRAF